MEERQGDIHAKGFDILEYGKMNISGKMVNDSTLIIGPQEKNNQRLSNKATLFKALAEQDTETLSEISQYFYRTSGIYQKTCNYLATMYRYDWYIVPEIYGENPNIKEIITSFNNILNYLDNSYIKKLCGDIALNVVRDGAYYGYIVEGTSGLVLQDLPIRYCRARYNIAGVPAVEFDMRYFDENFPDANYRMRILKMFPKEFSKGYILYKQGKLPSDNILIDRYGSWYLLEPASTVKFSLTSNDAPILVNAIPEILDLDTAQELDRRKQLQKLLKIVVQKLPIDKNGDLIFDVDEAKDIHANAVAMLRNAIGVDVLTTFTDVDSIDISDKATTSTTDELERVERAVYNALGISQNLFNTDGNLSLEKSILNDEGSIRSLLLQFAVFFDKIVQSKSPQKKKKKFNFRLYMLETTQYNYKELSKMYKEQVQIGYSKMLPQIALGHSQSAILNTAFFENDILDLSSVMIPPLMSSTLSSEDILGNRSKAKTADSQKNVEDNSSATGGRPEKADSEKSEKTIANQESMS